MNEKEIGELRRRLRPDKNNITCIRGCFVNEKNEIVSEFNQSIALMPEEESDKLLALLKRTLTGGLDKNLIEIPFATAQVVDSDEHRLLMALRGSSLEDAEAVQAFFSKVIASVGLEDNYLILLAYDRYDLPYRAKDGARMDDASGEVFTYLLCAICPVKMTKPALSYYIHENAFHNCKTDWLIAPPELGFLFPAFDDRSTNLYSALYYTRDIKTSNQSFVDALFRSELPMPAAAQKQTFRTILEETLGEDCCYEAVQAVHDTLCDLITDHKEQKQEEPLIIYKGTVKAVLEQYGVSETRVQAFDEKYDTAFGEDTALSPKNIVDPRLALETPDVAIHVNPTCSHLVETRMIDGKKYILIRADEGVQVNGVQVQIS